MKKGSVLINLASSFIINFSKKKKNTDFCLLKDFWYVMWLKTKIRF